MRDGLPDFYTARVRITAEKAAIPPEAQIVGLLHDLVEDTPVTFEERAGVGFSQNVLNALRLLTHDPQVPYEDYIQHVKTHPVATEAKLADLEDNMDIRRLLEGAEKAVARFKRSWLPIDPFGVNGRRIQKA